MAPVSSVKLVGQQPVAPDLIKKSPDQISRGFLLISLVFFPSKTTVHVELLFRAL